MLKKIAPFFTTAFLFLSLFATNILACACCVEKGYYSISVLKPDTFYLNLLKDINFATSNLYTNAAYPENVRGINPLNNKFTVNGALSGNIWSFNFKDD